jgi:hypothetical protein
MVERKMKLTKTKLKQLIKEELSEMHGMQHEIPIEGDLAPGAADLTQVLTNALDQLISASDAAGSGSGLQGEIVELIQRLEAIIADAAHG